MTQFDNPRTKALAALIATHGPEGTGRITGLSIEPGAVFIYTDSAIWCDDSGAGTFAGPSESSAVARYKARVQPGNGCAEYPQPGAFGACRCDTCKSGGNAVTTDTTDSSRAAIGSASQYVTVYDSEAEAARPVATLSRPRVFGGGLPLFRLVRTDGQTIKTWSQNPSLAAIRAALWLAFDCGPAMADKARHLSPAQIRESARHMRAESSEQIDRACDMRPAGGCNPGTIGKVALLLNLAALRAIRAGHLEALAVEADKGPDGPDGGNTGGNGPEAPETAPDGPEAEAEAPTPILDSLVAEFETLGTAPGYDMAQHDLAPVQSGGFPLWAFADSPVDHMREYDLDSAWADLSTGGL